MGYSIRSWADRYNGRWVVIRDDGKVMTESPSVKECLRWVKTWGEKREKDGRRDD